MFQLDVGFGVLQADRRGVCRYLWETWSPTWRFPEQVFEATAPSFDNPDFVDIVLHAYRHGRHDDAPGDPAYADREAHLAASPPISVPTVVLRGADDGVDLVGPASTPREQQYTGEYARHVIPGAGHFLHRERPGVVVDAVLARL